MKQVIRLEELGMFIFSLYLFSSLPFPWWTFPVLLLAPDLSMVGYAAGPRVGALVYNVIHHRALALAIYVVGALAAAPALSLAGVILLAHSSLDRALGYGLKLPAGFTHTHLGRIGRDTGT